VTITALFVTALELLERARCNRLIVDNLTAFLKLLGPDGLLSQVAKAVRERALAEDMTEHLGYERHKPEWRTCASLLNCVQCISLRNDYHALVHFRNPYIQIEPVQWPDQMW
jgi:hypothetical protein